MIGFDRRHVQVSPDGYARVSTTDQSLRSSLVGGRVRVVGSEKRSGTTTEGRDALRTALDFLRRGDVLMVTRIDRLARSIGDLQDIVRDLKARGASLKATEQPIDTQGLGASEIAKAPGIGRASVYRVLDVLQ